MGDILGMFRNGIAVLVEWRGRDKDGNSHSRKIACEFDAV